MVAYVRTVKTASGAVAVQVVWSSRRGSRQIEHLGSAHDEAELETLKAAARQRVAAGQLELDLGLGGPGRGGPLPITSSRMGHLVEALERAYRVLGFEDAAGGDDVFRQLVLARVIEPASKLDSIRVLGEAGVAAASYRTIERRLPAYAKEPWRQRLSAACAAHARLGPASLVLYDVSTLFFETDKGDGFREPGFSKERRLEPQITIGLLTDQAGFPLMVSAFEGNKAVLVTWNQPRVSVRVEEAPRGSFAARGGMGVLRTWLLRGGRSGGRCWAGTSGLQSGCRYGLILAVLRGRWTPMPGHWQSSWSFASGTGRTRWLLPGRRSRRSSGS